MPTNTQKKLLSKDTIMLIEAGFLSECLKITDEGRYYLEHLMFMDNMDKMVARAAEKLAEEVSKFDSKAKPKKA